MSNVLIVIVNIIGTPYHTSSELCRTAAFYYSSLLLKPKKAKTIDLTIEFSCFSRKEKYTAFCTSQSKNEFLIEIDRYLGKRPTLLALAHEMVHLKQYATGELKEYVYQEKTRWKGNPMSYNDILYWDHPWEIEAYGREKGLYYRFVEWSQGKT